jgi:hypothetical protein
MITETDEVAAALEAAERRWPEDRKSRAKLLLRLVHAGHEALRDQAADEAAARREAIRRTRGALSGVYGPNYLAELRRDWPE